MKKIILLFTILINVVSNAQNKDIIKDHFLKQSINRIEKIAFENGLKSKEVLYIETTIKSGIDGIVFGVTVNSGSKIFESEMVSFLKQLPRLNPKEYLHKGKEMKYVISTTIKLSSKRGYERRIAKKKSVQIKYNYLYIKEYFPIKWIKIDSSKNNDLVEINNVPVSKKCKHISNEIEMRKCFYKDLKMHVLRKFDHSIVSKIGMSPGKKKLTLKFVISKKGEIVNVDTEAGHEKLIEEGNRVINSYPNFIKPAFINGKAIDMNYKFPISFNVQ